MRLKMRYKYGYQAHNKPSVASKLDNQASRYQALLRKIREEDEDNPQDNKDPKINREEEDQKEASKLKDDSSSEDGLYFNDFQSCKNTYIGSMSDCMSEM